MAHKHGYGYTIELGNALEEHRPGPKEENTQDYYNNELGARIGNAARILGWNRTELGNALKRLYRDNLFQADAYGVKSRPPLDLPLADGLVIDSENKFRLKGGVMIDANQEFEFEGGKASVPAVGPDGSKVDVILNPKAEEF